MNNNNDDFGGSLRQLWNNIFGPAFKAGWVMGNGFGKVILVGLLAFVLLFAALGLFEMLIGSVLTTYE